LKITAPGFVLLVLFNVSEDAPLQWRKQHRNVYVTCRPKTTTGDVDRRVVMWGTKDLLFLSFCCRKIHGLGSQNRGLVESCNDRSINPILLHESEAPTKPSHFVN